MSAPFSLTSRPTLVRVAQLVTGVLLAWAALAKLGDIPSLAREIHNFRVLPIAGENLLAIVLPWIELTVAASLVLGIRPRAGAITATALMVVFTAGVALAMARGLNVECGCFGTALASRTGATKLLVNLGILAVAAAGILSVQTAKAPIEHSSRTLEA